MSLGQSPLPGEGRGQMAGSEGSLLLRQGLMNEEECFSKSSV